MTLPQSAMVTPASSSPPPIAIEVAGRLLVELHSAVAQVRVASAVANAVRAEARTWAAEGPLIEGHADEGDVGFQIVQILARRAAEEGTATGPQVGPALLLLGSFLAAGWPVGWSGQSRSTPIARSGAPFRAADPIARASGPAGYTSTGKPDLVQISIRLPSVSFKKKFCWPSRRVVISVVSTARPRMCAWEASMSSTSKAP